jgi:hypothetical protein
MNRNTLVAAVAIAALMAPVTVTAQNEGQGRGQAVITVLPVKGSETAPTLTAQDLAVKIGGKDAIVTNWIPLRGANDPIELVLLIDSGARSSMATQMGDIEKFVRTLPPNAKAALAYMENGAAQFSGPLTTDHEQILKGLHIPAGFAGEDGSPYFCLSDLAKNWPSNERGARRIVVMIGDGIDYYNRRLDLDDPYVQAAIEDSVRAGLVVYTLYWENKGRADRSAFGNFSGQSLLSEVTQSTGGYSYFEGTGNPVTFEPYFKDLDRRLQNQYELSFAAVLKGKPEVEDMKLKVNGISGKVDAPQQVYVGKAM